MVTVSEALARDAAEGKGRPNEDHSKTLSERLARMDTEGLVIPNEDATLGGCKGVLSRGDDGRNHIIITNPEGKVMTEEPDTKIDSGITLMMLVILAQKNDSARYQNLDLFGDMMGGKWGPGCYEQPACWGCP